MKKFLSIFLTLCLMLTVVAVPLPAIAETSNKTVFDFENYNPNGYIKMSGRVDYIPEPENEDNTVIVFNNNGIPYRSATMDKSSTYTKSGSDYTQAAADDITAALATNPNAYSNYYHVSAMKTDLKSTTKNTVTYRDSDGLKTISFNSFEAYNAIELDELEASTTYRITINYKRVSLVNPLYVQPVTWDQQANWRYTMYVDDNYERMTIPTGSGDSDWQTDSIFVTTPADLVDATGNNNGTDPTKPTQNGNVLRLVLFTGVADANNVVYFDNITVEKITYADLTYNYADEDKAPVVVEDLIVGDAIDYADLAPNKMGENNGKWYTDEKGAIEAPDAMIEGGLNVYEVVQTGVFDFNNYYRFQDYTGNNFGINSADVVNSIYADGNGNIIVDTTKYNQATNRSDGALRNYVIAIGEAKAATSYKITVEYSYNANNADQRLILTPETGYGTLTYTGVTDGKDAIKYGDSVELPQGTNKTIDLFYTTVENFSINKISGKALIDEVANSFYLNVITKEDGQTAGDDNAISATISKVTVTEATGSVTYFIPENATVNGVTGDEVTIHYYGDEVPSFPTVDYAEGYTIDSWTDTETGAVVKNPVLGGNYTLVVKEPVEMVNVTLYRGGTTAEYKEVESVPKGSYYTLPDTEFTDTSWWGNSAATTFVGYEGEEVPVNANVTYYTYEAKAVTDVGRTSPYMYRNWTGLDTTTEAFSYLYKTDKSGSAWEYDGTTRVCTRLGVVEDGKTYRISVTYKANTDADINFHMSTTNITNSGGTTRNYLEDGKAFHVVKANTKNEDWTTATFYITADLPAQVTENTDNSGLDDTKEVLQDALYLNLGKETGGEDVNISIKKTLVEDMGVVVTAKGASVLTEDKAEIAGSQAIRYYFDYATNEGGNGTKIMVGGTAYDVIERGFLYTNGAITHYAGAGVKGTSTSGDQTGKYFVCGWGNKTTYGYTAPDFMMWLAHAKDSAKADKLAYKGVSGEALANNWAFNDETDTVRFSTYVTDIPMTEQGLNAKMMVRGYVIFEADGAQHIVYSETINRSVKGIKDALGTGNNTEH